MANSASTASGGFMGNLGKVYGFYTIGFAAFVAFLAILEQVGVPDQYIGYGFIFFTIAIYAGIGIISRTANVSEYYVAGRKVPAFYNGMATGSDWMSAASFIAWPASSTTRDMTALPISWLDGRLRAGGGSDRPYLRKFGCYTVPDFFAARYGGNLARFLAIVVLLATSFTYVTRSLSARPHCPALPRDALPVCGLGRPCRHHRLLAAWRHAGRDLDTGRSVHRADRRLSDPGRDPVGPEIRPADPAVDLWSGSCRYFRARAGNDYAGAHHSGGIEALCSAFRHDGPPELLRPHPVPDGPARPRCRTS